MEVGLGGLTMAVAMEVDYSGLGYGGSSGCDKKQTAVLQMQDHQSFLVI